MTNTGMPGQGDRGKRGQGDTRIHFNGFTLLEVMVAVAILGMVLVTLLGVKNRSMQDVALADHITTATLLAKRKMNEILVAPSTITTVQEEAEGEFPEWRPKADLQAGIQPLEDLECLLPVWMARHSEFFTRRAGVAHDLVLGI